MTECILIKGFKPPLLRSVWCQGVKSVVRTCQLWQLPGQAGWHWVSGTLLVSLYADHPHFAAQHNVAKDNAENWVFFSVIMIVLIQFPPLTLSYLTTGCLLKKVNKPARNLWVTRHQWEMLIIMEGPKLKDTKSSTVTHWTCTECCSRRKRYNFNLIKKHTIAVSCFSVIFSYLHFFQDVVFAVH